MNLHRRLIEQARQAGAALGLTVLAGIAGGVLVMLQARQLSRVIARVFLDGQTLAQVTPLLWALLAVILLRALAALLGEVSANWLAVRVKTNLRKWLYEHLFALGPAYLHGQRSGELATAAMQGVEALDAYYSQYLPQVILAAAVPVILAAAVFPLDTLSGWVLLLTAPLIPLFMVLVGRTAEGLTQKQYTALSRMSAFFLDTLQGLAALKTLGQGQRHAARIADVSERYRTATMGVLRVTFLSALVLELAATLSTAVIAVQIGLRLLYGQLGFEQALFILVIAPDFYQPLRQLGARFHAGMAGVSAAQKIFALFDEQPQVKSPAGGAALLPEAPFTVEFERVSYAYAGRSGDAVADVSFRLRPGEQVALLGVSGSGKSTLASLLMGFIQPQQGKILINGVLLDRLNLEAWRRQMGWVPQNPHLLRASIADNLRIANMDAGQDEMQNALELAGLAEWAESLPDGLNTLIGEGGAKLSGGQAQRLALARAFLRGAPLLVLDEPTAQLDPQNEARLVNAVKRLSAGRSVLTIAHRFPTVLHADHIIVLAEGRVVEQGRHADLRAAGGVYADLAAAYEAQP